MEGGQNIRGVFTDVARDYNNSHTSGGRGGDSASASNITIRSINVSGQGGPDPPIIRHDDLKLDVTTAEESPSDIYARLLLPKKHGYPLWFPDPHDHLPADYQSVGVNIGDVGMITFDGGFDFIFNICHPPNDPINWLGVPDGFVPLSLNSKHIRKVPKMYDAGTHISSARIYKAQLREEGSGDVLGMPARSSGGFKFECLGSTGAVLMLPEGGSRVDLLAKGLFHEYAMRNAAAWYQFVNGPDLDRRAESGSLYLVTGCDKSPAWGILSSLRGSWGLLEIHGSGGRRGWHFPSIQLGEYSSAIARTGCQQDRSISSGVGREPVRNPTFNQCVFIRGFRISLEQGFMRSLLGNRVKVEDDINPLCAAASSADSSLPGSTADSSSQLRGGCSPSGYDKQNSNQVMDVVGEHDTLLEYISSVSGPYHPLVPLNNHLLDSVEGSKIAITHDDDWHALLEESDEQIPEDAELIGRLAMEKIRQVGDVVFLASNEGGSTLPHLQAEAGDAAASLEELTSQEESQREISPVTSTRPPRTGMACLRCRAQKAKCAPLLHLSELTCRRCLDGKHACIYTSVEAAHQMAPYPSEADYASGTRAIATRVADVNVVPIGAPQLSSSFTYPWTYENVTGTPLATTIYRGTSLQFNNPTGDYLRDRGQDQRRASPGSPPESYYRSQVSSYSTGQDYQPGAANFTHGSSTYDLPRSTTGLSSLLQSSADDGSTNLSVASGLYPSVFVSATLTEDYLRRQLNIPPSQAVNLRALPDPPPGQRPSQSLSVLIKLAIHGSPYKKLTLREICLALKNRFDWFRENRMDEAWKSSISHTLSTNKVFRNVRGNYWVLDITYDEGYMRESKLIDKEMRLTADGEKVGKKNEVNNIHTTGTEAEAELLEKRRILREKVAKKRQQKLEALQAEVVALKAELEADRLSTARVNSS